MADVRREPADQRKLLLADGQRSLSALQRSLSAGAAGGGEAALHITDLASLVSVLGFKPEADGLKDLAHGLSEDPLSMLDTVQNLLTELQLLLLAIDTDDQAMIATLRESMAKQLNLGKTQATPLVEAPLTPALLPLAPDMAQAPLPTTAGSSAPWPEIAPFFSAGLNLPPYAATTAPPIAVAEVAPQPLDSDIRAQALETVQAAGLRIHAQQGAAANAVLQELAVAQDGLMRVGQLTLSRAYPQASGAADVWVDPPVSALLEHLQVFSQRASRITCQLRHLTLFVTWQGATLSQSELVHVGHSVADLHGRVDLLDGGVQLVLPVSEQRRRMVSFRLAGQWQAVSWAQFLGWDTDRAPSVPRLRLRAGVHDLTLNVEAEGPTANMNLYPWPVQVLAPADLVAVALDGVGQLHQVRRQQA